jgi:hypothetical protein
MKKLLDALDKYKIYKIMNLEINSDIITFLEDIYIKYKKFVENARQYRKTDGRSGRF